jgi:hypothetical protein
MHAADGEGSSEENSVKRVRQWEDEGEVTILDESIEFLPSLVDLSIIDEDTHRSWR